MANFSFTVTLLPKMYVNDCDSQYDQTKNHLYMLLKQITNNFTLVSELTSSNNIHYHGIIELPSTRKFHNLFRKSEMFGHVSIREIYDMVKWKEYLKKSISLTASTIERRPIISDDYKVFTLEEHMLYGTTY